MDSLYPCREQRIYTGERERERERERDTDTDRDRDRETDREAERQRETERKRERERDRETERERDRDRETERDREAERERVGFSFPPVCLLYYFLCQTRVTLAGSLCAVFSKCEGRMATDYKAKPEPD